MSESTSSPHVASLHAVRQAVGKWESESVERVWRRGGDWSVPQVEQFSRALIEGDGFIGAAMELGFARAQDGVGVAEAFDDLIIGCEALGSRVPPTRLLRAFFEGWTEGHLSSTFDPVYTDSESGLGNAAYLRRRLVEAYGKARKYDRDAGDMYALVVVDALVNKTTAWQRSAHNAITGMALQKAYGDSVPTVRLSTDVYAVLVDRDEFLGAGLQHLRECLQEFAAIMRLNSLIAEPPGIWVERLPKTQAMAVELISSLPR